MPLFDYSCQDNLMSDFDSYFNITCMITCAVSAYLCRRKILNLATSCVDKIVGVGINYIMNSEMPGVDAGLTHDDEELLKRIVFQSFENSGINSIT